MSRLGSHLARAAVTALAVACGGPDERVVSRPFEAPPEVVEGPVDLTQDIATESGTCHIRADATRVSIACDDAKGARIWGHDEVGGDGRSASFDADSERLYAAWFWRRSPGGELVAYDLKSGAVAWRTPLRGLGRVGPGRRENAADVRATSGGLLRALVWESGGHYTQQVYRSNGRLLGSDDPPPPMEPAHPGASDGIAFVFDGPSPRRARDVSVTIKSGAKCSLVLDQEASRTHLACALDGARTWGVDLAEQFVPGGALAADETRLFVAEYCAISSGASVTAYDLASGRFLWKTSLHALGPVDHSEYYNDVDVRVEGGSEAPGRVVVSGWEAYGKYVEVLDAATGAALGNRREPG